MRTNEIYIEILYLHLQVKPGILNQAFPKAMFPKALGSHKLQIKLIFP